MLSRHLLREANIEDDNPIQSTCRQSPVLLLLFHLPRETSKGCCYWLYPVESRHPFPPSESVWNAWGISGFCICRFSHGWLAHIYAVTKGSSWLLVWNIGRITSLAVLWLLRLSISKSCKAYMQWMQWMMLWAWAVLHCDGTIILCLAAFLSLWKIACSQPHD